MKPSVFVSRKIPAAGLELLEQHCSVDLWTAELPPSYDTLLTKVRDKEGVLYLLTEQIDSRLLDAAGPGLKVLSGFAVGYDNVDIPAATERGIPVGHTPGVLTETTADLAFALLLSAGRRIYESARFAQQGRWQTWSPTAFLGRDAFRATLGILGMGRIGQAMARRAQGFEMEVVFHDPNDTTAVDPKLGNRLGFDEVLSRADFLSVHVPLTPQTRHLIDRAALQQMKPTATLINTSRGPVVDHDALTEALAQGEIGYAALDVTEPEPLPDDHPLFDATNCLIVPHIGSASVATRDKMASMAAENLLAGLRGRRLPHCVNPEVYRDAEEGQ